MAFVLLVKTLHILNQISIEHLKRVLLVFSLSLKFLPQNVDCLSRYCCPLICCTDYSSLSHSWVVRTRTLRAKASTVLDRSPSNSPPSEFVKNRVQSVYQDDSLQIYFQSRIKRRS